MDAIHQILVCAGCGVHTGGRPKVLPFLQAPAHGILNSVHGGVVAVSRHHLHQAVHCVLESEVLNHPRLPVKRHVRTFGVEEHEKVALRAGLRRLCRPPLHDFADSLHVVGGEHVVPLEFADRELPHAEVLHGGGDGPVVDVERLGGLLPRQGRPARLADRLRALLRPLGAQLALEPHEPRQEAGRAEADGGRLQNIHRVPPSGGHEQGLPRHDVLLDNVGVPVQGKLLVVGVVRVHVRVHLLTMVQVRAHLRWPQAP
mmetsp:Transcript_10399/g.19742  ORF Transcript_10399/g.19742 Transcript_10399/m.19742 type:complete len:258 (+) Transcript_10399:1145-1918(+)